MRSNVSISSTKVTKLINLVTLVDFLSFLYFKLFKKYVSTSFTLNYRLKTYVLETMNYSNYRFN